MITQLEQVIKISAILLGHLAEKMTLTTLP